RFANRVGTIVQNVHVDRGRKLFLERRQEAFDVVGDVDGVRSGLALDAQNDGSLRINVAGIEPGRGLVVLNSVDDVSQLLKADWSSVSIGHHQRVVGRGAGQLSARLQGKGSLRTGDLAGGQVYVPVLKRGFDFVDSDLVRRHAVRVHLDVNGI